MGEFKVKDNSLPALRDRYESEAVPIVRATPGNIDCFLLEPVSSGDPILVCTIWEAEADATAYEASGSAERVVNMIREFFAGPPALRSYRGTGEADRRR
jgi:heme-degrading monooxygenase HmoA